MGVQKLLPGPPGDDTGEQQLIIPPSAPPSDVTVEDGLETVTVTATPLTDWGKVWFFVAVAGAIWYLASDA